MKKKIIILTTILSSLFSSTLLAKDRYAKVIKVEPVYQYQTISTPREICHNTPHQSRQHSAENTVIGVIIGGTIGNAIGHNNRNGKITTAAGAIIGGIIGHELGHKSNTRYNFPQQCITSYEQTRKIRNLTGYNVLYRFNGQIYQTFSRQKPTKKIKVNHNTRQRVRNSQHHSSQLAFQH